MNLFFLLAVVCSSLLAAELNDEGEPEGLEAAKKDVAAFKEVLKQKTPEQIVSEFIADGPKRLGGYEYFYKYMANIAIRDELAARGKSAESALRANVSNKMKIWEAINGPGNTVGRICSDLLGKLPK